MPQVETTTKATAKNETLKDTHTVRSANAKQQRHRSPSSSSSSSSSDNDGSSTKEHEGQSNKKKWVYESELPWYRKEVAARKSDSDKHFGNTRDILEMTMVLQGNESDLQKQLQQRSPPQSGTTSSVEIPLILMSSSVPCTTSHLLRRTLGAWDKLKFHLGELNQYGKSVETLRT